MTAQPYSWPTKVMLASEALIALARARMILHRTRPDNVLARNEAARRRARRDGHDSAEHCRKIAFIIPQLAPRLPWRADCLVQALAGQDMLARRGTASRIVVGTAKHPDGTLEAHAWLACGEVVVLGGDVARFVRLLETPGHDTAG